ncbi:hypothetical protein KIPB_001597 [Kipferlia bialata]|uniref:Kelch-type beta propeller n=1 Tax=Kipferlia bialata TaxID=797122 RepID=A0A391NU32_9EUKA|nr:hypothetical protein KIPB_001597 [Kipferlia bialata]|eukprot:g1597.t1
MAPLRPLPLCCDDRMVVVGGLRQTGPVGSPPTCTPSANAYDPNTSLWVQLEDAPVALHSMNIVGEGGMVHILGGRTSGDTGDSVSHTHMSFTARPGGDRWGDGCWRHEGECPYGSALLFMGVQGYALFSQGTSVYTFDLVSQEALSLWQGIPSAIGTPSGGVADFTDEKYMLWSATGFWVVSVNPALLTPCARYEASAPAATPRLWTGRHL